MRQNAAVGLLPAGLPSIMEEVEWWKWWKWWKWWSGGSGGSGRGRVRRGESGSGQGRLSDGERRALEESAVFMVEHELKGKDIRPPAH